MLKLLQSIFGGAESKGRYPDSLIDAAIERAVDGTDSRLRALPGYRRQLRDPVVHAIDHVVALIDDFPAPVPANRGDYGNDARLRALFASPDRMMEVYGQDAALGEFRNRSADAGSIAVLLLAERAEKRVIGMELSHDRLRGDVAQTTVSFEGHRLVDPAMDEGEARRLLKRRAFDHLLALALTGIVDVQGEHSELRRQRAVLMHKRDALHKGGWGFDGGAGTVTDCTALQAEIDAIETQISALKVDQDALNVHLKITADLLGSAERQLWAEDIAMNLDSMNILRESGGSPAEAVRFRELHNARGRRLVMLFLSLELDRLPERESFISSAARYLR